MFRLRFTLDTMAFAGISPHNRSSLSYKISLDTHEPKDEPFLDRVERWIETNQCSATLAAVLLFSVSRCVWMLFCSCVFELRFQWPRTLNTWILGTSRSYTACRFLGDMPKVRFVEFKDICFVQKYKHTVYVINCKFNRFKGTLSL